MEIRLVVVGRRVAPRLTWLTRACLSSFPRMCGDVKEMVEYMGRLLLLHKRKIFIRFLAFLLSHCAIGLLPYIASRGSTSVAMLLLSLKGSNRNIGFRIAFLIISTQYFTCNLTLDPVLI